MDLKKIILKEHNKATALKVADYVGNNTSRFKLLVNIYLEGPYRVTQRAAWPLSLGVERHPELIKPHLVTILDYAAKPGVHDAVKRNTVRLLQFIEIPKKYHGKVLELCFDFLQSKKEPVAVKVFSMTVIANLVKNEPDLKKELKIIIEDQLPYTTAAFASRARKVLKQLGK